MQLGRQEGVFDNILEVANILHMDLDLGRWICMVLEWTPEEASLLHGSRIRPFSAAASVYISREAWETQQETSRGLSVSNAIALPVLAPHDNWG